MTSTPIPSAEARERLIAAFYDRSPAWLSSVTQGPNKWDFDDALKAKRPEAERAVELADIALNTLATLPPQGRSGDARELLARLYEARGNKAAAFTLRQVGAVGCVLEAELAVLEAALGSQDRPVPDEGVVERAKALGAGWAWDHVDDLDGRTLKGEWFTSLIERVRKALSTPSPTLNPDADL